MLEVHFDGKRRPLSSEPKRRCLQRRNGAQCWVAGVSLPIGSRRSRRPHGNLQHSRRKGQGALLPVIAEMQEQGEHTTRDRCRTERPGSRCVTSGVECRPSSAAAGMKTFTLYRDKPKVMLIWNGLAAEGGITGCLWEAGVDRIDVALTLFHGDKREHTVSAALNALREHAAALIF